jgi:hypothetical protein
MLSRDQARFDLVTYHKSLIAGRTDDADAIEKKYDLHGYPPRVVSVGLQAASEGRDPFEAIDDHLDASD